MNARVIPIKPVGTAAAPPVAMRAEPAAPPAFLFQPVRTQALNELTGNAGADNIDGGNDNDIAIGDEHVHGGGVPVYYYQWHHRRDSG